MLALVTGAYGFAGSHLVEHLLDCGDRVIAVAAPEEKADHLLHVRERITEVRLDLRRQEGCRELIETYRPDVIFHLAAVAFLPDGESDPAGLFAVNVGGAVNLGKAVVERSPQTGMVYISSAEVYGMVDEARMPVDESQAVEPANLYAFSKSFAEQYLSYLRRRDGMNLVVCRPFTHIGPRQSHKFAASAFARQIALIEKGQAPPVLQVGNLAARRDIMDVKDTVRAYRMATGLLDQNTGPFNIGTGRAVKIQALLDILLGLTPTAIQVKIDPSRLRPLDIPIYSGNAKSFSELTGWSADIPLEQTLQTLLDYWRQTASPG